MRVLLIATMVSLGFASSANAQGPATAPATGPWKASIGAGVGYAPDYEGSDDYEYMFLPSLNVSHNDLVFLDSNRMAIGVNAVRNNNFRLGPMVKYRGGRDEGDNNALRGLGDIDYSLELGIFAEATFGNITIGLDMSQDISEGHEGFVADLGAAYKFQMSPKLRASVGTSLTWADSNYMSTFFGMTNAQCSAFEANTTLDCPGVAGNERYDADSGIKDVGLSANMTYSFTPNIATTGIVSFKRLMEEAADSPLVEGAGSKDQFFLGVLMSYRF